MQRASAKLWTAIVRRKTANVNALPPDDTSADVLPETRWQQRLTSRWAQYISAQAAASDNQYGSGPTKMDVVRRYAANGADILFLGCGDGLEVWEARNAGYNAHGVTLGSADVARANAIYGLTLTCCDAHFLPMEWEERYDAVFGFQFLEHSLSPFLLLWEVHRVLRVGGWCYFEVPHATFTEDYTNWHHLASPTPPQMRGWLRKLGFTSIMAGHIDDSPDASRWAWCAARK